MNWPKAHIKDFKNLKDLYTTGNCSLGTKYEPGVSIVQ